MSQQPRTMKTVRVPAKCFSSDSRSGPSPTNASRAPGILSRMSRSTYRFFSAQAPTHTASATWVQLSQGPRFANMWLGSVQLLEIPPSAPGVCWL